MTDVLYERAGRIVNGFRRDIAAAEANERSMLRSVVLSDGTEDEQGAMPLPRRLDEAAAVIKELMDECMRRDTRENHARRKADELVSWLNGRWG